MFAEEKSALPPLPVQSLFAGYLYGERTSIWTAASKSRPPTMAVTPGLDRTPGPRGNGMRRTCGRSIRSAGQLPREHLRQQRVEDTAFKSKIVPTRTPPSTQQRLRRAEIAGPAHWCVVPRAMHQNLGEEAVRRILGVLNLTKKYGVASTDDGACALGLEPGASHLPLRAPLHWEHNPHRYAPSLRQVDPPVRQLTLYRDLIESRTQNSKQENPA